VEREVFVVGDKHFLIPFSEIRIFTPKFEIHGNN